MNGEKVSQCICCRQRRRHCLPIPEKSASINFSPIHLGRVPCLRASSENPLRLRRFATSKRLRNFFFAESELEMFLALIADDFRFHVISRYRLLMVRDESGSVRCGKSKSVASHSRIEGQMWSESTGPLELEARK